MAKTSNRTDMPKIKKQKPLPGAAGKAAKISNEWIMPQNASDVAMYLVPYGKIAKATGKAVKKVVKSTKAVKASTTTKKVTPRKRKMF
jgi:hypothetical protein